MASPNPSSIAILYEDTPGHLQDITGVVIFASAHFDCQANAVPGTFGFTVKDVNRNLSFVTGREVYVELDGIRVFGGLLLQVSRVYAFPAVNTEDIAAVTARQWQLQGVDFNIWFDKRVLRNPADYKSAITVAGVHTDAELISNFLPDYIDVPPGVDMSSEVDPVENFGHNQDKSGTDGYTFVTQGHTWREQMDEFAARSASVYYIDPFKKLHFKALEDVLSPWAFVDWRPNGVTTVGIRDVAATQDGAPIVTDALVWGGLEQLASGTEGGKAKGVFFARYPVPPADDDKEQDALDAQAQYGRWQYSEANFNQGDDQTSVDHRAKAIIMGPPGQTGQSQGGLRFPLWEFTLTWFAHDVPGAQHIRAGYVADILLYVMGKDRSHPLIQTLPLRTMQVTFPQIPASDGTPLTFAQFTGSFGLSYSDSRHLWKFLIGRNNRNTSQAQIVKGGAADATSLTSEFGNYGGFTPNAAPDGFRHDFQIPFGYLVGSTRVYLNGLLQRPNVEYTESNAVSGIVTFYTPPVVGDTVFIECRTAMSLATT